MPEAVFRILDLAEGKPNRPLDRLERGLPPLAKGQEAVEALAQDPSLKDLPNLPYLRGALYLYFDCFDQAHQIAQDHEDARGNWLHAFLHRREPDAGNAKYWYARTPLPASLSAKIAGRSLVSLGNPAPPGLEDFARKLSAPGRWEPGLFVDLCEKARRKGPGDPAYGALAGLQRIEWEGLVEFILG
jgi:hypothetical protein